ncbi:macro domain-like protein [Lactarius psammicola]|nr:macro domain-like protein [Lactarius psammicola]
MSELPHFILIAPPLHATATTPVSRVSLCQVWTRTIGTLSPELQTHFTVLEGTLSSLPTDQLQCDCVVSPANSFGIMDGGYDLALSLAFQGTDGVKTLSRQVQRALHVHSHGYLPPGSCIVTSLPGEVAGKMNKFGASSIAVMPTMRYPVDVRWHQDLIYNAMWNLLVEVTRWNSEPGVDNGAESTGGKKIERILMTGLATGTGKVSARRCAKQMMLAVRHFAEGVPEYADWVDVDNLISDVNATVGL